VRERENDDLLFQQKFVVVCFMKIFVVNTFIV
jgi:hypothetical protein